MVICTECFVQYIMIFTDCNYLSEFNPIYKNHISDHLLQSVESINQVDAFFSVIATGTVPPCEATLVRALFKECITIPVM